MATGGGAAQSSVVEGVSSGDDEDGGVVVVTTKTVTTTVRTTVRPPRRLEGGEASAFFMRAFQAAVSERETTPSTSNTLTTTNSPRTGGVVDAPRLAAASPAVALGRATNLVRTPSGGERSTGGQAHHHDFLPPTGERPVRGSVPPNGQSGPIVGLSRSSAPASRQTGGPDQPGGARLATPPHGSGLPLTWSGSRGRHAGAHTPSRRPDVLLLTSGVEDAATEGVAAAVGEEETRADARESRPTSPVRSVIDLTAGRAGRRQRHVPQVGTRGRPLELLGTPPESEDGAGEAKDEAGESKDETGESGDDYSFHIGPSASAIRMAPRPHGRAASRPCRPEGTPILPEEFDVVAETKKG
ncbi:unnamed protein product, partial [Ectocarpus sp. 4 AP-2014]